MQRIDDVIEQLESFKRTHGNLEVQIAIGRSADKNVCHTWPPHYCDTMSIATALSIEKDHGVVLGRTKVGKCRDDANDLTSVFIVVNKPKIKRNLRSDHRNSQIP